MSIIHRKWLFHISLCKSPEPSQGNIKDKVNIFCKYKEEKEKTKLSMVTLSPTVNEQAKELGTDRKHNDKEISQSV